MALLVLAAGWGGKKPAALVQGEVTATPINVVPQVAGTLQTWRVRQGEKVKKGQLLVCLENPGLQAKLEQARATMASEPNKILGGSCVASLGVQSNWWMKAKAVAENAQQTFDRSRELKAAGVISQQELQATERDLDLARSSERAAKANFDLAVAMCGEIEKLAFAAEQQHATQKGAELETLVENLKLTSPIDGEVQRHVEQGEWVTPGSSVASIVDLQDVWVRFNLPEDLLSAIRIGSTFHVRVPSLGNQDVLVRVNHIAPDGGSAPLRHAKKTVDFVRKTFEVRAVPVQANEGLRPGMSVLVDWRRLD